MDQKPRRRGGKRGRISTTPLFVVLLTIVVAPGTLGASHVERGAIEEHEAEILLTLSTQAQEVRAQRMEVGIERETSEALNQEDYFHYFLYNLTRKEAGSVTIGHFSVNRHTGDLWDADNEVLVTNPDLESVLRILLKAHEITPEAVAKYRHASLWAQRKP